MKKILSGLMAGLMLLMLLTGSALAAEDGQTAKRQEDLDYLYSTLKSEHPNLFANTPEETFLARKAEIESRLATENDFYFNMDCESLAALVKDSHTSVSLGSADYELSYLLFDMEYYGGKWIASVAESENAAALGAEVTAINGIPMEELVNRFSAVISADNPVRLRLNYWHLCYVRDIYDYLGISVPGEPLSVSVTLTDGTKSTISVESVSEADYLSAAVVSLHDQRTGSPKTAYDKKKTYTAFSLSDSVYYIQYNSCIEDKDLPMEDFCAQVSADLSKGSYSLILVDLRNNGGGSDGLIGQLLNILGEQREAGVSVAGLIGRSTFSSAIINSVELREMGFPLLGEDTLGSVDHFGAVNSFKLPNSGLRLGISSKFISMHGYFDAAAGLGVETLSPDVTIEQTLSDYLAGRDTCVEAILADPSIVKLAARETAPMTRARFVGRLYELSGASASQVKAHPFADALGFEWYIPALCWAKESKVALGRSSESFESAGELTWQEAAVFAVRAANALSLAPKAERSSALPETLRTASWNEKELSSAWAWGLIPEKSDYSAPLTRAEGEAMLAALFN